jgi:hypothetical protein
MQAFDLVRTVQGGKRTQYSAVVDYSDCNAHAPLFVRIVRILGDRKYGRTIRQDRASGEGSGLPSISPQIERIDAGRFDRRIRFQCSGRRAVPKSCKGAAISTMPCEFAGSYTLDLPAARTSLCINIFIG